MDEIEYKLKSQNSTLISHGISKLLDIIIKNLKTQEDIAKIPEFKTLSSKCSNDDFIVSTSACQALVILVKTGSCDAKLILTTFMICLSSTKNYEAIAEAVSQLLILDHKLYNEYNKYTLQVPNQHPFITILNQEKRSWASVLNQMKFIMYHHDKQISKQSIELLRPVFIYILCNPSIDLYNSYKREAWQLIIKSDDALDLRAEILLWLCTNQVNTCIDTNCRILELAEVSFMKKDMEYCTALAPLIASLTIQLLHYGNEPVQNFHMIMNLMEQCCYNYIGDIMIILMAEIILICPAAYLQNAFEICTVIMDKMPCNVILLYALAASLLKWLAYPSLLCSDALPIAKNIVNKIISQKETNRGDSVISTNEQNKVLLMFNRSNMNIRFYTEFIHSLYSLKDDIQSWLENLSLAPIDLRDMCKLVICGIFLYTSKPGIVQETCRILVQMSKEINTFASHMLSLLLHKLTKSYESSTSKCLLLAIPEFVIVKENVPIIMHTLNMLQKRGKSLQYLAIQLYARACEKEPRCYRFMSSALMDIMECDHTWYSDVACTRAIKIICESRPELSEELVPLLSKILNRCVDANGGAASAIALDCISILCEATVIGICSTWKLLAPKMRKEKRTVVLVSLCELFANVPSYTFWSSDDHESFFNDVLKLLWSYVVYENTKVAISALKALKSYHFARIPLSALPVEFRSDIVIPQAYIGKTASNKPEDILDYIPGTCWIQMLKKMDKNIQSAAGDLLISYIEEELGTYKSQIYNWPLGEPRNFKYLPERSIIKAIGEYLRRSDKTDPSNWNVMVQCLRIFAHSYTKPLPNIQWNFLMDTMQISEEAKEYSLSIMCRHSYISLSAKQLVEAFLLKYKNMPASDAGQLLLDEKHMIFYSYLHELTRGIQSQDFIQFLETSLDYVLDKMLLNEEKAIILFNRIMSGYASALRNRDDMCMENRIQLFTMLSNIFNKVDLTLKSFEEYFTAMMELPIIEVERMTSPSIWWEVTQEKIKNVVAVGAELAFRKYTNEPLTLLNEPINLVASNPISGEKIQKYLLENIQRVLTELKSEVYCVNWILDLMSRINAFMMESSHAESKIVFYCDVLFISVICLCGMDRLLPKKEMLIVSRNVRMRLFPQAVVALVDRQIWKSVTRQIMNWMNHMRTSFVPVVYKPVFESSLILLRHEEDYNSQWTNYLSIETCIHT